MWYIGQQCVNHGLEIRGQLQALNGKAHRVAADRVKGLIHV